jgi:hypothetical protein
MDEIQNFLDDSIFQIDNTIKNITKEVDTHVKNIQNEITKIKIFDPFAM